jgi:poly(A) polymerase
MLRGFAADWESGPSLIVGGAVRDALLARSWRDIDVAVPGDASAFAARAAELLGTCVVVIGNEQLAVHHLPLADGAIDVVPMQGGLDADLARRDLTFNAMAVPLAELPAGGLAGVTRTQVIDRNGGLADLDAGVVRFTGPEVVADDPLRTMRAVRIATELGFQIEPASRALIGEHATKLGEVAAERVGAEIEKLFSLECAQDGVTVLDTTGLMDVLFPELALGKDVEQRPWHVRDVYQHQLSTHEWLGVLLGDSAPSSTPRSDLWMTLWRGADWNDAAALRAALAKHQVALRLAALLHDIGKPATRTVEQDGRTRFFGHAELGADMAEAVCRRWRLSNSVTAAVAMLVRNHLRPGQVAAPGELPTSRALFRFHRDFGDAVAPPCWLFLADSLATVDAEALLPRWHAYVTHVRRIIEWSAPQQAEALRLLVDGHAVMRATGMAPGPALGQVLDLVQEAIAANEVVDEVGAVSLARRLASQRTGSSSESS